MTPMPDTKTDARPVTECWACGGAAAFDPTWPVRFYRCPNCGLMFTAERPPEVLQELYTEGYFTEYPNDLDYLEEIDQRRYEANRRLAFLRRHCAHGRLLEIGAASGHFLEEACAV